MKIKVKVKAPFIDASGLHKRGEICEVSSLIPHLMTPIEEEKKEVKNAAARKGKAGKKN